MIQPGWYVVRKGNRIAEVAISQMPFTSLRTAEVYIDALMDFGFDDARVVWVGPVAALAYSMYWKARYWFYARTRS